MVHWSSNERASVGMIIGAMMPSIAKTIFFATTPWTAMMSRMLVFISVCAFGATTTNSLLAPSRGPNHHVAQTAWIGAEASGTARAETTCNHAEFAPSADTGDWGRVGCSWIRQASESASPCRHPLPSMAIAGPVCRSFLLSEQIVRVPSACRSGRRIDGGAGQARALCLPFVRCN